MKKALLAIVVLGMASGLTAFSDQPNLQVAAAFSWPANELVTTNVDITGDPAKEIYNHIPNAQESKTANSSFTTVFRRSNTLLCSFSHPVSGPDTYECSLHVDPNGEIKADVVYLLQ